MTVELTYLTLTAILAASLWIPYIVGVNATKVPVPDGPRPHDPASMTPWVHRAFRAHLNLLEQFLPVAVIVLIAHAAGVSTVVTQWAAGLFFAFRIAHAVWMIGGLPVLPGRPLIFTAGWLCILIFAGAVLLA